MGRHLATLALTLVVTAACTKPIDPPPAPPATITQRIFEPVYRASKAIQGSIAPGVTYAKLGELLQHFATEITIAKDQQMNDLDKRLHQLYIEAFAAYDFSHDLWSQKLKASEDYWNGEIPVGYPDIEPQFAPSLALYKVLTNTRKMRYSGRAFTSVAGDSIQHVWSKADEIVAEATEMYYGRQKTQSPATSDKR
jgi:hypothetical protein